MSKYCFLCLSDEGVFLSVTPNNYKSLYGEIETYLPVKIENKSRNPNKVCYKCAYELKQCCDFVKRYKESHTNAAVSKSSKKRYCNLCSEPAKNGYIFKLDKEKDLLNNPLIKIKELFDGKPAKISKTTLVCLTCRYSLDVLFDLMCLCQEIAKLKSKFNNDIDYSEIPKVNTAVIKRKTTNTSFMRTKTYIINDSDSDSGTQDNQSNAEMNKNSQPKLRLCDQCHKSVEHGGDMYRFHRTGLTVCKTCWMGIDQDKRSNSRKKKAQNTKQCTVFLKDVLSDANLKQQKPHRVEKDNSGNQVYIITESESEVEVEDKKGSETPEGEKEIIQTRSKRRANNDISENATKRKKPTQVDKQNKQDKQNTYDLPQSNRISLRSSTRGMSAKNNHYSDTDIILHNKLSQNAKTKAAKRRNTSISSVSDVDTVSKRSRIKLRTIEENLSPSKDETLGNDTSLSEDSKQDFNIRKRTTRSETRSRSTSTNDSELLSEVSSLKSNKSPKINADKSKLSKKANSPHKMHENETDIDGKKEYSCNKCSATYENKLIAVTHELTHFKQLELKLHRISNEDKLDNEKQDIESSTKQLIDELAEQQNEEITLTVNDDEELEITNVIEDITKKSDKEACISVTSHQEDLLKLDTINKESAEESKVAKINESVHEKLAKADEDANKVSDIVSQDESTATYEKNEKTRLEDATNNQIQNDDLTSEAVKDKQKLLHDEIVSEDKTNENKNTESAEITEGEIILSNTTVNKDEKEENENVESTKTSIEDNITKEIETDEIKELEKEETENKEGRVEETEENKIEKTKDAIEEIEIDDTEDKADDKRKEKDENTEREEDPKLVSIETEKDQIIKINSKGEEEKEQNSNRGVKDDQKDLNANNAELKDTFDIDKVKKDNLSQEIQNGNLSQEAQSSKLSQDEHTGNLSQESQNGNLSQEPQNDNLSKGKQSLTEHEDDGSKKLEKNAEINTTSEKCIENSSLKCDIISGKDNIDSGERKDKEINVVSTEKEEKENVKNVNSNELSNNKEGSSIKEANNELDNTAAQTAENIFDLTTDEHESAQIAIDHHKRYNDMEAETLENISREIQKSADMPSLDPINSMEVDHSK